ncbi:MAG: glycosyltransferase [Prevotellamassilia sp.]|nr:glycosyltransferase [Prevotellamassilia sp.]
MDKFINEAMKPRIFIAIHYMHLGGAETSLIGLLQALDPQNVDVDLFVYSHEGEMMKLIPSYVNLLPEDPTWSMFEKPLKEVLKKGYLRMFFARMWAKFRMWNYVRKNNPMDNSALLGYVGDEVNKILPDLHHWGEYDLAISFLTPHNFVLDHVTAKKKICWIHTDYTRIDVNAALELPVWSAYDQIISISDDVTNTFLQIFPSLKDKIVVIENILSPEFVCQRAELISRQELASEMPINDDYLNLLTIGRFSPQKKLEEIPAICRGIVEAGVNVRWYVIGYGGSDDYIRREIEREGMQEHVFLLGKKENPYPYIKACDWYVQPSRYEGKSVVVREAQMLCKPVIVTNYPTAPSQIQQGVDGVIVPMEIPGCLTKMVKTLKDDKLKCSIVEYLEVHDYGNMGEVEKVYALI